MAYEPNVNHPLYYAKSGRDECIVEMEKKYGEVNTAIFCLMSAYKYIYRAGEKEDNPQEQDMEKAVWYFDYVQNMQIPIASIEYMRLYHDISEEVRKYKRKNRRRSKK